MDIKIRIVQYLKAKIYSVKAKSLMHVMTSSATFELYINDEHAYVL